MHSRPSGGAAIAIAAIAIFTVWITWRAKALELRLSGVRSEVTLLNKQAPDFQLPATDGRTVSLAEFRGKKNVVVTFWASWCGPCRLEAPVLSALYTRTHKPDSDFEFLAVSIDDTAKAAEQGAEELKLPYPVLLDLDRKVADAYGVQGIPTLFVIGKNGVVEAGRVGFDVIVETEISAQLHLPPAPAPGTK